MNEDLKLAITAAQAGGDVLEKYFGQVLEIEEKTSVADLRTKADVESEEAIFIVLKEQRPGYNYTGEESGATDEDSPFRFVVDPLDGTNNFALGVANFAISIGLFKEDRIILGVIYNPILRQLFWAERGKGAFMNGKPIHVSQESDIKRSTVSYVCGYNTERDYTDRVVASLRDAKVKRILDNWTPASDYCLLASGRTEAVLCVDGDLEDYAAAKLIVREAGGLITDFDGQPVSDLAPDFVATNGTTTHDVFTKLMK